MSLHETILFALADFLDQEANIARNSLEFSELHKTFPGRCGPALQRIDRMFVAAAVMRHLANHRHVGMKPGVIETLAIERLRSRRAEREKEFGFPAQTSEAANGS